MISKTSLGKWPRQETEVGWFFFNDLFSPGKYPAACREGNSWVLL